MCLAVPAKIVEIENDTAKTDVMGNTLMVDIRLLEDVSVGDYILIHAGFGIQKLDLEEAQKTIEAFRTLEEGLE